MVETNLKEIETDENTLLKGYLEGIGATIEYPVERTLENLNHIILQQVKTVGYQSLKLWAKDRVMEGLTFKELYKRLITERRGGYCFELAMLTYHALKQIGYEVFIVQV